MKLAAVSSLLVICLLSGASLSAMAKRSKVAPEDQNGAVIVGLAGESYPIYGAGGIRVSGGHHGFFSSNMKSSQIEIDGSGISAQKLTPANPTSDFTAVVGSAYFVSQSVTCTLASAQNVAGEEVVVCNTGKDATITYQSVKGETISQSDQPGGSVVNKTTGKVDRFISDGISWYRE